MRLTVPLTGGAPLAAALLLCACAPPRTVRLATCLPMQHARYLEDEGLGPSGRKAGFIVRAVSIEDGEALLRALTGPDSLIPDAVELPSEWAGAARARGLLRPLDPWLADGRGSAGAFFFAEEAADAQGLWSLPHAVEARVLLYRRSKVEEALRYWELRKDDIRARWQAAFGSEMPPDYRLEPDPADWDGADLTVLALFWKSQEWRGTRLGRVAASLSGPGQAADFWDDAARLGWRGEGPPSFEDPAVAAVYRWQAAWHAQGLFHPESETPRWTPERARNALARSEIFLACGSLRDAWLIRGTEGEAAWEKSPETDDLVVAPMPASFIPGVGAIRDRSGHQPLGGLTRITWLALPKQGRHPEGGAWMIGNLTSRKTALEEASRFGLLSPRRDVLPEVAWLLNQGWRGRSVQAAIAQLYANGKRLVPAPEVYPELNRMWVEARRRVLQESGSGAGERIPNILAGEFAPRQRQLLSGRGRPEQASASTWSPAFPSPP